jgi:hypothetical protein
VLGGFKSPLKHKYNKGERKMALTAVTKNEMLKAITGELTGIQLKFQDATTSAVTTEASLWEVEGLINSGILEQDAIVTFSIDTTGGEKNVSGFNLIFTDTVGIGVSENFPQIYNYPNNGTFTFDGTSITIE